MAATFNPEEQRKNFLEGLRIYRFDGEVGVLQWLSQPPYSYDLHEPEDVAQAKIILDKLAVAAKEAAKKKAPPPARVDKATTPLVLSDDIPVDEMTFDGELNAEDRRELQAALRDAGNDEPSTSDGKPVHPFSQGWDPRGTQPGQSGQQRTKLQSVFDR